MADDGANQKDSPRADDPKAELALLRLQSAALKATANAVVITDRDGSIVWVNPAFTNLTGYAFAEAIGKNPRDLVKSGKQDVAAYQNLWETIVAGGVWQGELVNRRKDGVFYSEEQTITPICNAAGEPTHFVAVKRDLTERKQAEKALRLFRELLDQSTDSVEVIDPVSGRFLDINAGAPLARGYTREEFLSLRVFDLDPGMSESRWAQQVDKIRADGQVRGEGFHRRKDGTIFPIEYNARWVRLDRDYILTVARDISDRRRAEAEKRLLEEKLLQVQRVESLGLLAAGIAHDLNNVLAPILMGAQVLRGNLTDPSALTILHTVEQSAERGASLVSQILGFARGTAGKFQPTQVKYLANDIISVIEQTFPKSIRLEHMIPADLHVVQGNPTQIYQVLLNLCVNARDAMPQGGTLRLTVANRRIDATEARLIPQARAGDWVVIEVADTGTGIAPEILAKIWEPFFTTKGADKGTGLGLSTTRGIVISHDGFITLDTQLGQGTTFRVFLPSTP